MAEETLTHVKQLAEGGVWTDNNLLGDDSWTGEAATLSTIVENSAQLIQPKTPAQEDREIISTAIKNPEFLSALVREIEKKMLKDSGRPTGTSVLQQITTEREEAVERIRTWVTSTQETKSVEANAESQDAVARVRGLEEKILSLELKIAELMTTSVSQKAQEKELIEEAYKILQDRRRDDDLVSNHTPSEITRMEQRTDELGAQILRYNEHLVNQPPASQASVQPAAKNRRRFGTLF